METMIETENSVAQKLPKPKTTKTAQGWTDIANVAIPVLQETENYAQALFIIPPLQEGEGLPLSVLWKVGNPTLADGEEGKEIRVPVTLTVLPEDELAERTTMEARDIQEEFLDSDISETLADAISWAVDQYLKGRKF